MTMSHLPDVTMCSYQLAGVGVLLGRIACTDCKDAAYCYKCVFVWTWPRAVLKRLNDDAVSHMDSGGLKKPCIRWGLGSHQGKGNFFFLGGGISRPTVKYREYPAYAEAKVIRYLAAAMRPVAVCIV